MTPRSDTQNWAANFTRPPVLTVLICLGSALPAYSQKVPDHLASMAANLFSASGERFKSADPETTHGWAEHQAHKTILDAGVPRWQSGNMPVWHGRDNLLRALEFNPEGDDSPLKLEDFIKSAWKNGTEAALNQLFTESGRAPPGADEMAELVKLVNTALSEGYDNMERRHVLANSTGSDLVLDWTPELGSFEMQVIEEGSEFQAPFQSVLSGEFQPDFNQNAPDSEATEDDENPTEEEILSGDSFVLSPLPEPIVTYDAEELEQIRGNVFGEWTDSDGAKWMIFPMDGASTGQPEETAEDNPRAIALARLNAAIAELDGLRGSKVYVWVNPDSGEREEQDRFRRKKDPWTYEGEQQSGGGTPDEIAALEAEVEELSQTINGNNSNSRNSEVPSAPELAEPTEDNQVQAIQVSYVRFDGTIAVFDQARLSGTKITGNRVLRQLNDISGLPDTVISQLISSWQPPEWIDLDVTMTGDGQLKIAGGRWRLHVTYSGMSHEVSRIHTPYANQTTLTRDDRRKAP